MRSGLPSRSAGCNSAPATAAPSAFSILATRPLFCGYAPTDTGVDRCEVLLRGCIEATPAQARRHALLVLDAMATRHRIVDVQVLDANNVPLLVVSAGGA